MSEKYSVLMSVYYKEKPEWLDLSIQSILKQTIFPDEFVIVEDGKLTDDLEKIIIKYCEEYPNLFNIVKLSENKGLGNALKIGILNCKNKYIARMDSDDYSVPDRIQKQFEIFNQNPKLDIVGSNVNEFEENIDNVICKVILPETNQKIHKYAKKRCPFRHPTLLYKKEAILNSGNYRDFYLFEDYDLYVRLLKNNCECYNIQEPLVYMRIGKDFYKRRGGTKYLKSVLKFKNQQLRNGYLNLYEYLVSVVPHIIVCLVPNTCRDWIYKKILRKK